MRTSILVFLSMIGGIAQAANGCRDLNQRVNARLVNASNCRVKGPWLNVYDNSVEINCDLAPGITLQQIRLEKKEYADAVIPVGKERKAMSDAILKKLKTITSTDSCEIYDNPALLDIDDSIINVRPAGNATD